MTSKRPTYKQHLILMQPIPNTIFQTKKRILYTKRAGTLPINIIVTFNTTAQTHIHTHTHKRTHTWIFTANKRKSPLCILVQFHAVKCKIFVLASKTGDSMW